MLLAYGWMEPWILLLSLASRPHVLGRDVCFSATIFESGPSYSDVFSADNVLDSTWHGASSSSQTWLTPDSQGSWFTIRLAQTSRVTQFHLLNTCNTPHGDRSTKGYSISVSSDNYNWYSGAVGTLPSCHNINGAPVIIGNGGQQDGINYIKFIVTSYYGVGGGLNYFAACESFPEQYRALPTGLRCSGGTWLPYAYAHAAGWGGGTNAGAITQAQALSTGVQYCASVFEHVGTCSLDYIGIAHNNGHCWCLPIGNDCVADSFNWQFRREQVCLSTVSTAYKSVSCTSDPGYDGLVSAMANNAQGSGHCTQQNADLEAFTKNTRFCGGSQNQNLCKQYSWLFVASEGTWQWKSLQDVDFNHGVLLLDGQEIKRDTRVNLQSWSVFVATGSHTVDLIVYEQCCDGERAGWLVHPPANCTTTTTTVGTLDLSDVDSELMGFGEGFADGTYGYVLPKRNPTWFGKVARFSLTDFSSVTVLDLTETNVWYRGFRGGFTVGGYGYLVSAQYNNAVRFSLATFSDVEAVTLTNLDPQLKGFCGGFNDGDYGYYVPFRVPGGSRTGKVCRISLSDFTEASVEILDLAQIATTLKGFCGGFAVGSYGYLAPRQNSAGLHGNVVRFSLSDFSQVAVLDLESIDSTLNAFFAGFSDTSYGYINSRFSGKIVRWSLADFSSVEVLDLRLVSATLTDFKQSFMDGQYGYIVSFSDGHLARFSLDNFNKNSVQMLDIKGIDPILCGFNGGFASGAHGYLVPFGSPTRNGVVVRFSLTDAFVTSTTTFISTVTITNNKTVANTTSGLAKPAIELRSLTTNVTSTRNITAAVAISTSALNYTNTTIFRKMSVSALDVSWPLAVNITWPNTTSSSRAIVSDVNTTSTTMANFTDGKRTTLSHPNATHATSSAIDSSTTHTASSAIPSTASSNTNIAITTTITTVSSPTTVVSTSLTTTNVSTTATIESARHDLRHAFGVQAALALAALVNKDLAVIKTAHAHLVAAKLGALPKILGDDGILRVEAEVPDSHVKAAVPASLLDSLGSDTAAIFAFHDEEVLQAVTGTSSQYNLNGVLVEMSGIVSLELRSLTGHQHILEDMTEHIFLTLAVNHSSTKRCQFWDTQAQSWSERGITTGRDKAGQLRCAVTHLSMFGGGSGNFPTPSTTAAVTTTVTTVTLATTATMEVESADSSAALIANTEFHVERAMLALGNRSIVLIESEAVTVLAVRMDTATGVVQGEDNIPRVEASIPGTVVKAAVPTSLLEALGEDVAGVLTVYSDDAIQHALGKTQLTSSDGAPIEVVGVVAFELRKLDGSRHKVQGLAEPILLTLPANHSSFNVQCQYLDEEHQWWSSDGVETDSDDKGKVVCVITHLSIFGAVSRGLLSALDCASFQMFSPDALKEIFVGNWWQLQASLGFFIILLLFVIAFGFATYSDVFIVPWHGGRCRDDSEFITDNIAYDRPRHSGLDEMRHEIVEEVEHLAEEFKFVRSRRSPGCKVFEGVIVWILSKCVRISFASYWRIHNKDVKRVARKSHKVTKNDQKMQRLSSSESVLGIATSQRTNNSFASIGSIESDASAACMLQARLGGFHELMMTKLSDYIDMMEAGDAKLGSFCSRLWVFFVAMHPLLSLRHYSHYQPASLRVLLFAARVFGCIMLSGIFFQAGGQTSSKDSPSECSGGSIWTSLVIAMVSTTVSSAPIVIILVLHTRDMVYIAESDKKKRWALLAKWKIEDCCMWMIGGLYTLSTILFTMVFLANIGPGDHSKYLTAVAYTCLKLLLVVPTFLSSTLAAVTYSSQGNPDLIRKVRIRLRVEKDVNSTNVGNSNSLDILEAASRRSSLQSNLSDNEASEYDDGRCSFSSNVALKLAPDGISKDNRSLRSACPGGQRHDGKVAVQFRTSLGGVSNALLTEAVIGSISTENATSARKKEITSFRPNLGESLTPNPNLQEVKSSRCTSREPACSEYGCESAIQFRASVPGVDNERLMDSILSRVAAETVGSRSREDDRPQPVTPNARSRCGSPDSVCGEYDCESTLASTSTMQFSRFNTSVSCGDELLIESRSRTAVETPKRDVSAI